MKRLKSALYLITTTLCTVNSLAHAQAHVLAVEPEFQERVFGPYDVHVLEGGKGLAKAIPAASRLSEAGHPATLSAWILLDENTPRTTLLAGLGDPTHEDSRILGLYERRLILRFGKDRELTAVKPLTGGWHLLAATFGDQASRLFADGVEVASGTPILSSVDSVLTIAPVEHLPGEPFIHFGGLLAQITLTPTSLQPAAIHTLAAIPPDPSFLRIEEASQPWPIQTHQQAGYLAPQDSALIPHSRAPLPGP